MYTFSFVRLMSFFVVFCFGLSHTSATSVNYAEVRTRLVYGFAEKANEMHDMISALQDVSKESTALLDKINLHCGKAVA